MALLRAQFRALVADQLRRAGTMAGERVYEWRALPTKLDDLPAITLWTPHELKASQGRGAPKFTTTFHLMIQGRVTAPSDQLVGEKLELLAHEIEMAVLANRLIVNVVQQFVSVETISTITMEGGRPLGEVTLTLQPELQQVYDPAMPDRLETITVTRSTQAGPQPNLQIILPA